MRKFSDDVEKQIANDYQQPMVNTEIYDKYGIGYIMLQRILKRQNVRMRTYDENAAILHARFLPLTEGQYETIIGNLLGDGSCSCPRTVRSNSRFSILKLKLIVNI